MVNQTIQIFARVKPSKKQTAFWQVYSVDNEEHGGGSLEFVVPKDLADGFINNKRENYRFRFQKVFDQATKQEDIFETIAKPVADKVLAGYNGTIFAYGQTGSGKTFTITGGPEKYSDRGIIPRTISYLYQHFSQDRSMVYTTHISYLEIYNEVGYDLLDPKQEASTMEDLPKVTVMEDPDQNIHLKNLSLQPSASEEEALNLLFLGDTNRMIAETPMNQASTRSHCIFTVHLCGREPGSATVRRSKLHLVDLAGSERVGKTGVGGQILTEAKYINLSLHFLEQVITALSEKNRSHIPYRNSVMTSVLRDSLGGNCMTTMIATVSVEKSNVDESISTCRFAQRVAMIKNVAILNEELDPAVMISLLKKENQRLKAELAMLTGEQSKDELTQEEIQSLDEQVTAFLEDSDPDGTPYLGPDLRKIKYCFSSLKARIQEKQSAQNSSSPSPPVQSTNPTDTQESQAHSEVLKLKDMLSQRDKEISVLVDMLKKQKMKFEEIKAQLANVSNADTALQSSLQTSISTPGEKKTEQDTSQDNTHIQHLKRPESLMDRHEAFEIFSHSHKDHLTIEDNKTILKQRVAEAKTLGEQLKQSKDRDYELKTQLERRTVQLAVQGLTGGQVDTQSDSIKERLRDQIKEEKKNFERCSAKLRGLKTEIEHLQHLLQKSKIKLQRDFEDWWIQEITKLQQQQKFENTVVRKTLDSSSTLTLTRNTSSLHEHVNNTQDRKLSDLSAPSAVELRGQSLSELSSTSIPLTGDPQVDADIMAFTKARQELLTKKGPEPLMDRHEAFEIFSRSHKDHLTIEDNRTILNQRVAEAKELGVQRKQSKDRVYELKTQLERRRMQLAVQGLTGGQTDTQSDSIKERLCDQIKEEKKNFERCSEKLRGLKTEIEHLQHLLQKSDIKLQRDFEDWWLQQQQRSENTAMRKTLDSFYTLPPTRGQFLSELSIKPVPLIGDPQVDADIMAFNKARQELLTKRDHPKYSLKR